MRYRFGFNFCPQAFVEIRRGIHIISTRNPRSDLLCSRINKHFPDKELFELSVEEWAGIYQVKRKKSAPVGALFMPENGMKCRARLEGREAGDSTGVRWEHVIKAWNWTSNSLKPKDVKCFKIILMYCL